MSLHVYYDVQGHTCSVLIPFVKCFSHSFPLSWCEQDCQKFSFLKPTEQGCCQLILGWTSIKTQEGWPEIRSCVRLREIWRKKNRCEMYKTLTFRALVNLFLWDFDSVGAMPCAHCVSKHIKQSCMWQKSFVEWQRNPWTATITNVHYVNWYDVYTMWLFIFFCKTEVARWVYNSTDVKRKAKFTSQNRLFWVNLAVLWFVWLQYVSLFLAV